IPVVHHEHRACEINRHIFDGACPGRATIVSVPMFRHVRFAFGLAWMIELRGWIRFEKLHKLLILAKCNLVFVYPEFRQRYLLSILVDEFACWNPHELAFKSLLRSVMEKRPPHGDAHQHNERRDSGDAPK